MIMFLIILSAVLSVLSVVQIFMFFRIRIQCQILKKEYANLQLDTAALQNEIKALLSADITFGRALQQLKKSIHQLESEIITINNQHPNDTAYQQSLKMLDVCGDPSVLEDTKILNKAEAALIKNLHHYQLKLKEETQANSPDEISTE